MALPRESAAIELLTPSQVEAYLARIGHAGSRAVALDTLTALHRAHLLAVPFENLDIHLGQPLSLDADHLAAKVVTRRRGGFCYELNGLFCSLLVTLGFTVRLVEARTRDVDGQLGPRFDHARILATVEGRDWLVDVGTGASPRGPIGLTETPQVVGGTRHRVVSRDGRYDSQHLDGDTWRTGWSFDDVPRDLSEFAERCEYHQRSPDSHFTHKPVCTLVTERGHVTLADRQLITTEDGHRHEQEVTDPLTVLAHMFGIVLPRWPGT